MITHLFPFCYEAQLISTIRARIGLQRHKEERAPQLDLVWQKYLQLALDDIKESLRAEITRRDQMNRRAQGFLGSVAVLSAFTIGTTSLLRPLGSTPLNYVLSLGILGAVVFLGGAAWYALQILRPEQLYDVFLQARFRGEQPLAEPELKETLLFAIQLDQAYNLIFATYSERSYRCLRNGFICLLFVLILVSPLSTIIGGYT